MGLIWGCQDPIATTGWLPVKVGPDGRLLVGTEPVLDLGIATAGTNTTLTDNTKNWEVNMWAGAYIEVIIAGTEYHRAIISSTADTLTFNPLPALVVVAAGDLYCIKASPFPTASVNIDPYTDATGANIAPAVVRSTAITAFRLVKVHIHWAAATSNPVTIALDANAGAVYDTVLLVQPMGANTDMVWWFAESALFEAGDAITVAWTNDIGALAWGVQIGWME